MILRLDREESESAPGRWARLTFGDLYADGEYFCATLEDEVREIPGRHVVEWKVAKFTAIPSGTFHLALRDSPHFGTDTPIILDVPGFTAVEMHGGEDIDDTEGCVLVGSRQDRLDGTLHGAKFAQRFGKVVVEPVLATLKEKVRVAVNRGEKVFLQVRNAPAWYAGHGLAVPKALPAMASA